MAENTTAVTVSKQDKPVRYTPYGGKEEIELSIKTVQNLIAVKTRSGKTCSEGEAIKFLLMCKARLLNPWEGDAFLIGYDGKDGPTFSLITAHQAFLKRAELNPEYDGMQSGIIVRDGENMREIEGDFYVSGEQTVVGGWAKVFFKNRKYPMYKRVRLERFKKSFGIWLDDSAGMIAKCAEADALRSAFPTMLGGLYLKEETATVEAQTSAPIFKEPTETIPEAEVVADKPVPPATVPPPVPVPTPRPVKAPQAPKTPPAAVQTPKPATVAPVGNASELDTLRQKLGEAELTPEQAIAFLRTYSGIDHTIETLNELALQEPESLTMLVTQFDDIAERIKNGE